jgi:hypothetical protein
MDLLDRPSVRSRRRSRRSRRGRRRVGSPWTPVSGSPGRTDPANGEMAASGQFCGLAIREGRREGPKRKRPWPRRGLKQGRRHARPRRLRMRYERAGRSFYSSAAFPHTPRTKPLHEPAGTTAGHVLPTPPRRRSALLSAVFKALAAFLTHNLGPSSIPSLGDGGMLDAAWIDRPVDTRGCTPLPRPFRAAWKCSHAQANDRHSSRVFAMPPRGFARTTRNG